MPVTVPGTNGGTVTLTASSGDHLALSQQLSHAMNKLAQADKLAITQISVSGATTIADPPSVSSGTERAVILVGGSDVNVTVPAGYHHVIHNTTGRATIVGSDVAIITNSSGGSVSVSGNSTVAASGGHNALSATGILACLNI